ncbi:MAG: 2-(1,2-epoxy-1,2-dihydrophenyl)acetyl-CoA isomerase [Gammaproteobacteria bacterium]|nr:2-(1,2-epoxy-1,2-dihydrophenyl)acetyl-CoA isomerase [Gammaproteobacteria bacterium]
MYQTIQYDQKQGYAVLTLDRPDQLNSFNQAMHDEVMDVFKNQLPGSGVRSLLITGSGRAFCSGQDLNERKFEADNPPDLRISLENNYNPLVRQITSLEYPVICAVNGIAAGAGVGIALACDIVLAARSAEFILSFSRVGLGMDCASSWSLPRLVGLPRAMAAALFGDRISAERAEDWGMIWKCMDDEALLTEATKITESLSQKPTLALGIIKRELRSAFSNTLEEQLVLEAENQEIAGRSDDYYEGIQAFFEKRKPDFKGK